MESLDTKIYQYQSQTLKERELSELQNQFAKSAIWYRHFFKNILPNDKSIRILDIPCGHGNILTFLQKEGYTNVKGYDIDKGRIDIATSLGFDAAVGDGLQIVREARDVDVIFSLDFLEHLDKEVVFQYLNDCHRALNDDGLLIIRMPVSDNILGNYDLYNDLTHKWTAHSHVIEEFIRSAGFKKVLVKDERPQLFKAINYVRYGIFLVLSNVHNLYLQLLGFPKLPMWSRSAYFIASKK